MINTAKEFFDLRTSERPEDYLRAAKEDAPIEVWYEVLGKYPEMKVWVSRNKTVPIQILEQLASDANWRVRAAVATKNKLSNELMLILANDPDPSVREQIARNKNASDVVLRQLSRDAEVTVCEAARHQLALREI